MQAHADLKLFLRATPISLHVIYGPLNNRFQNIRQTYICGLLNSCC